MRGLTIRLEHSTDKTNSFILPNFSASTERRYFFLQAVGETSMTGPGTQDHCLCIENHSMELAFAAMAIMTLLLAFKGSPKFILRPTRGINVLNKLDQVLNASATEANDSPSTVNMGNFGADSLDDIPTFLIIVAAMTRENNQKHEGHIHVLSLHEQLKFQVVPDAQPTEQATCCFQEIWRKVEDIEDIDMQNVVMREGSQLVHEDHQKTSIRVSLTYIGPSTAAVVLSD